MEYLSTKLFEGFKRLNQVLHKDPVEKPNPTLPQLIIATQYDHPRLANIAFNETSVLLAATTEDIRKRNILLQVQIPLGGYQEIYVNVLMGLGLGEQLDRQVRLILFRRGRNFVVDFRNKSSYEGILQDAWVEFTSKQKTD